MSGGCKQKPRGTHLYFRPHPTTPKPMLGIPTQYRYFPRSHHLAIFSRYHRCFHFQSKLRDPIALDVWRVETETSRRTSIFSAPSDDVKIHAGNTYPVQVFPSTHHLGIFSRYHRCFHFQSELRDPIAIDEWRLQTETSRHTSIFSTPSDDAKTHAGNTYPVQVFPSTHHLGIFSRYHRCFHFQSKLRDPIAHDVWRFKTKTSRHTSIFSTPSGRRQNACWLGIPTQCRYFPQSHAKIPGHAPKLRSKSSQIQNSVEPFETTTAPGTADTAPAPWRIWARARDIRARHHVPCARENRASGNMRTGEPGPSFADVSTDRACPVAPKRMLFDRESD